VLVADFPQDRIEVACTKCARRGSYKQFSFPTDARLPDILAVITQDCPRSGPLNMTDRCGASFPQLMGRRAPEIT
jgi:hypothetical protein